MSVVYDDQSESYLTFVLLISESSILEPEDRSKLLLLAPFMTPAERKEIENRINFELTVLSSHHPK